MASPVANAEQIRHWNEVAGPAWVAHQERLDAQLREHGERALAAAEPRPGERVLDVGCGCGDTSLALARRVAPGGSVTGVDISEPMLARARERAAAAQLANLAFVHADASRIALPDAGADLVFSRFGVMFFDEPRAAFAHLGAVLAAGGRLCFVCWQAPQHNPWIGVPLAAVTPLLALPPPPAPGAPGMFSLADPRRVRELLGAAGFADVSLDDLRLPIEPGAGGVDGALEFFLGVGPIAALVREQCADAGAVERVRGALRDAFSRHARDGRVVFDSAAWIVRARRPESRRAR